MAVINYGSIILIFDENYNTRLSFLNEDDRESHIFSSANLGWEIARLFLGIVRVSCRPSTDPGELGGNLRQLVPAFYGSPGL